MARSKKAVEPEAIIEEKELLPEDPEEVKEDPEVKDLSPTDRMMLRGLGLLPPGEDYIPTSLFISQNVLTAGIGGALDADIDNGVASFNIPGKAFTDIDALTVDIIPDQSGSGDPAPDNVRPISGWTGADITVSPTLDPLDGTTYTCSWYDEAGVVYGGTLDETAGKLSVTMKLVDLGNLSWSKGSASTQQYGNYNYFYATPSPAKAANANFICSQYKPVDKNRNALNNNEIGVYNRNASGYLQICIRDDAHSGDTAAAFKTAMSGVKLVYELATPVEYDLTQIQINALLGVNNIWADCGPVTECKYSYYLLINQN